MRTNRIITVTQIEKRQRAQSSTNEGADSLYLYNISLNSIKQNSPLVERYTEAFFKGCENRKNANKHYSKCLSLIEDVKDNDRLVHVLENMMGQDVVPYIDNLDAFKDSINRHNLPSSTVDTLMEAVKVNKICQRILNNNTSISTRFNFDKYIKENTHRPMEDVVLKCCSMIDTYKTPGYAKMNIALEELSYLYQKNAVNYDKSKMIQLVTEYFLNRSQHIEKSDMALYKNVLLDNCCISDADLSGVTYFINEDFTEEPKEEIPTKQPNPYDTPATNSDDVIVMGKKAIDDLITPADNPVLTAFNVFKISEDKTPETFESFEAHILSYDTKEIVSVLPAILDWFRNFAISNLLDINNVIGFITNLINKATDIDHASNDTVKGIINALTEEINKASTVTSDEDLSAEDFTVFAKYANVLQAAADSLMQYTIDNDSIETAADINKMQENGEVMSLDEFKIFKFQNLITAALKVDKALARTNKKVSKKIKDKAIEIFGSFKKWLNESYTASMIANENILDCISESGYFDHTLRVFKVKDITDISEVHQAFKEFCSEMNNEFGVNSSIRVYYESIDNLIELHICDSTFISLTEQQYDEWNNIFTETEQFYAGYLMSISESVESLANIELKSFVNEFSEIEPSLTADNIVSIIELSTMLGGMISYNRLLEIAENYSINNPTDYVGNNTIKHTLESWKLLDVDIDIQAEAVSLLHEAIESSLLLEADNPNKLPNNVKKNDDKKSNQNDEKKPGIKGKLSSANDKIKQNAGEQVEKTKINFNTLRYAMEALKTKAKGLGDKATKASHELDVYVEKFVKSIKALYTNDNREAIIKGSVIPSFHQLMGRLMVIGGAGGAGGIIGAATGVGGPAGAVFAAAVTAFATIAISKHTTEQQRRLMLDEIDIEIQVCDRELAKADNNGQIKKARALLTRKRKLQREMSRIKYHIGDSAMITSAEAVPDKD